MEHQLSIQKTVRYYTYGDAKTAKNCWIVLHGYAQLPKYFIRKFHALDPTTNYIVAPEGFHRFYRKGTNGRVGASWMTREARLDDIQDNIHYLNTLSDEIMKNNDFENRIILGFSQGGATAARWHHFGKFNATHFILWASVFPPDLPVEKNLSSLHRSLNYFFVGTEDEFLKTKIKSLKEFFSKQPFAIEFNTFQGNHIIKEEELLRLYRSIYSN